LYAGQKRCSKTEGKEEKITFAWGKNCLHKKSQLLNKTLNGKHSSQHTAKIKTKIEKTIIFYKIFQKKTLSL